MNLETWDAHGQSRRKPVWPGTLDLDAERGIEAADPTRAQAQRRAGEGSAGLGSQAPAPGKKEVSIGLLSALERADFYVLELGSVEGTEVEAGDRLLLETPGGGGWGSADSSG
jgi:N-methylhydantoinase B/oxoprolinase/acetone carboxylase alpha subunit